MTALDPTRSAAARVEVFTRPGCHLCEQAVEVVAQVCADLGESWVEHDINDDPEWLTRFTDQVPVTWVDGRPHDFWRVDPRRLRAALTA